MKTALLSTVAVLALAGVATAAPLNLVPTYPDATSGAIWVSYNASSQQFRAVGRAQQLRTDAVTATSLFGGQFLIEAMISNAGNLVAGSSTMRVLRGGANPATIFSSSSVSLFGFGITNRFEFVFASDGTGIDLLAGAPIGTILTGNGLSFAGGLPSFQSSFSNQIGFTGTGAGVADSFIVPAPGAAAALGLGGLVALRRRRK